MQKKFEVIRIDEMDYGCEGIPEGEEPMVSVLLKAEGGKTQMIRYPDALLYQKNINVGDWVINEAGQLIKIEV